MPPDRHSLVVFDIDGTLTDTNAVDARCYAAAVEEVFHIADVDRDWSKYTNVTDSGILRELLAAHRGQEPAPYEITAFIASFVARLETEHVRSPGEFAAIPGAKELTDRLRAEGGWRVALATGGWRESARTKLRFAEMFDLTQVPMASADDSRSRIAIVERVIHEVERRYGGPAARVVLVGDAPWDIDTARALRLPFLGIGREGNAESLRERGAPAVIDSFEDVDCVLQLLSTVDVPTAPHS